MLQIRQAQLDRLKKAQRTRFLKKTSVIVRRHWPQKFSQIDEQGLELILNKLIDQARYYDITGKKQVLRYINLAFLVGQEFDREKWAIPIFHSDLDQCTKIDRAYQYVRTHF